MCASMCEWYHSDSFVPLHTGLGTHGWTCVVMCIKLDIPHHSHGHSLPKLTSTRL